MNGFELGWAVGLLEGEGYFRHHGTLEVSVDQVNREPLDHLQSMFEGSIRAYGGHWRWVVYGARARDVMDLIAPHMSARRQRQIREALDA